MNKAEKLIQAVFEELDYKYLKKNKIPLDDDEHKAIMDAGAVWHWNGKDKPSAAVWKARMKSGEIRYGCNTHRAMVLKKTLKGAINAFDFIKTTA